MRLKTSIGLRVVNNTPATQNVSILGSYFNQSSNVNALTTYEWNVTGFTFGFENTVSIFYKLPSAPTYFIASAPLASQSINSVVASLNSLGLAVFFTYTSGGNTFIGTTNDTYIFNSLNLYDTNNLPMLSYAFQTTQTGKTINIDVNGINQVSFTNPINQNGTVPVSFLDTIDFYGDAGSPPYALYASVYENNNLILNLPYANFNVPFNFNFTLNKSYYTLLCYT